MSFDPRTRDRFLLQEIALGGPVENLTPENRAAALARLAALRFVGANGRATARGVAALLSDQDRLMLTYCSGYQQIFDADRAARLGRWGLLEQSPDDLRRWRRTARGTAVHAV